MIRIPQYDYSVHYEKGGGFWWAESKSLEGCVGQGETREEAISELAMNEIEWIEEAKRYGIPIPVRNNRDNNKPFVRHRSDPVLFMP